MLKVVKQSVILATFLVVTCVAWAAEVRDVAVGSAGSFRIELEDNWKVTPSPPDSGATISIEARQPGRMHMLVTGIPTTRKPVDADIKKLVQGSADKLGPVSVEKTPVLVALKGVPFSGYYFKATDPAPNPGEFRFLHQGATSVDAVLVTFTVLFNANGEKEADLALASLRKLKYLPPGKKE